MKRSPLVAALVVAVELVLAKAVGPESLVTFQARGSTFHKEEKFDKQRDTVDKFCDFLSKAGNKVVDLAEEWKRAFSDEAATAVVPWEKDVLPDSEETTAHGEDAGSRLVTPSFEISENDSLFEIAIDLPGVQVNDIDIDVELETGVLTVRAERKTFGMQHQVMQFAKRFRLNPVVNLHQISAKFDNGVLILSAPKIKSNVTSTPTKIPIESSNE